MEIGETDGERRRGNGHRYRAAGNHFRMHRRILAARHLVFPFPSRARIRAPDPLRPPPRENSICRGGEGPWPRNTIVAVYEAK